MDMHRLAEERSLAYHRVIAARLGEDPTVLEQARARVREWVAVPGPVPHYARAWAALLGRPVAEIVTFLTDPGERARELRQSTPFAGVIPPRERWGIWRAVRDRLTRPQ